MEFVALGTATAKCERLGEPVGFFEERVKSRFLLWVGMERQEQEKRQGRVAKKKGKRKGFGNRTSVVRVWTFDDRA